jgi:hypothetical protein
MIFLRPLLCFTRSDSQRNPDLRNKLKVNNLIGDKKLYQNSWLDHLERTDRSRLPKLDFHHHPEDDGMLEDPRKIESSRTP